MHLGKLLFVSAVLVSSGTACKKDDKKTEGGGGEKEGGGGGGAKPAGGFEAKPISFEWSTWGDGRRMQFDIQANLPKGWKLMTEGDNVKMLQTFMPGDTDPKTASLFSTSSVTFSATCHGSCTAKDIPEQVKKTATGRGGATGAKILQDAEVSPGVWAYVIETETYEKGKMQYEVGVSHYNPDWDSVVFCNAMLFGDEGKRYKDFVDACASSKIEVVDVVVGKDRAAAEEANLAKCPTATTLTYTAKEPKPESPTFTEVKAIEARSSSVGSVSLKLANVARTGDEWSDKPLEPGEGIVEIWLGRADGGPPDILSGTYKSDGSVPMSASISLKVAGGTSYPIGSGGKGDVEVIARTRKKICGKIDAEDQWHAVKGEFVAELTGR